MPPMGLSPRRFLETQASQQPDSVNKGFVEALGPSLYPPILDTQRAQASSGPSLCQPDPGKSQGNARTNPAGLGAQGWGLGNGAEECCSQPGKNGVGLTKYQEEQGRV